MRSRINRHVGHRASILLALAVVDLVYGLTLLTSDAESTAIYRWFDAVIPLPVWAVAWLAVGVVCAVSAFREDDLPGFQAAWVIKVFWALGAVAGFFLGDVTASTIVIWAGWAFVVWRVAGWSEPPMIGEDRDRDD